MCGIAGIVFRESAPLSEDSFRQLTRSLAHRGPDHETFHFGDMVWLGHRRLSIVDSAGGRQPIWNENKTIVTIYNGEIYNFLDIRADLERKGHVFSSQTDGEVLVHLYEEYGLDFVSQLDGMFAFAIWDSEKKQLLLARDRHGMKPLYVARKNGCIFFSSELRSLTRYAPISDALDPDGVMALFTHDSVPAPRTVLADVEKLRAGSCLLRNSLGEKVWLFEKNQPCERAVLPPDMNRCKEALRETLSASVRSHLMGEVPIGVFLSGGLDSSLIAALAAQHMPERVKTFSASFEERSFDESRYAKIVATHLQTDHQVIELPASRAIGLLQNVHTYLDEPLGDPAVLPMYLLSEGARKHVTVALSGEGSDELFLGYPTYLAHTLATYYQQIPAFGRSALEKIVFSIPASDRNFSLDFVAKRFLRGAGDPLPIRHARWMSPAPSISDAFFTSDFSAGMKLHSPFALIEEAFTSIPREMDPREQAAYFDRRFYLQDGILMRTDKASMAHSLEVRIPFLDNAVVALADRIPASLKRRGFQGKRVLKEIAKPLLPHEIVFRKKKGFGLPISAWLKGELRELLCDTLHPDRIKRDGIFAMAEIERLKNEHFTNRVNQRKALWLLLIFHLWRDQLHKT